MNIENIKRVRDHIAGLPPERFDMRFLFASNGAPGFELSRSPAAMTEHCGTAACIAGWTLALLAPHERGQDAEHAARLLGLDGPEADELFTPHGFEGERRFTHGQAIRVLDHLLETGVVNWASPTEAAR